MGVINAVAQFERELLIERTQSGLARARAQGKHLGRPPPSIQRRAPRSWRDLDGAKACRRWQDSTKQVVKR